MGSCRGDGLESETDLHGGLAVRLLEICVINIRLHTELTRIASCKVRVCHRIEGARVIQRTGAHQVVILGLYWCHGSSKEKYLET